MGKLLPYSSHGLCSRRANGTDGFGPYNDDIQELHFDLPARHLAIYHSVQAEMITQSLQRLGLGAELQQTQPHYEPVENLKGSS